ncbi:MAG: PaaI family thioesterase [Dehalococcoidales bacterium]|nr:PaaI family thioesterase [Dehalococcoidales bacterium]
MPAKEVTESIATLKTASKNEPIAKFLGMKLVELKPGYAKITMKLKPEYQNFNGYVFGGVIVAVADHAFAYGSNSVAYPSVATQFNINFINAAGPEDTLTAECNVLRSGKRAGVSEITVKNQTGKLIAKATGVTVRV